MKCLCLIFLFCPLLCLAAHQDMDDHDFLWNMIYSKQFMYKKTRKALQEQRQIKHSLESIHHTLEEKMMQNKIGRIISSAIPIYTPLATGRIRLKLFGFKIYYNLRKVKYNIKYTFKF